jgi:hypothetical protein
MGTHSSIKPVKVRRSFCSTGTSATPFPDDSPRGVRHLDLRLVSKESVAEIDIGHSIDITKLRSLSV